MSANRSLELSNDRRGTRLSADFHSIVNDLKAGLPVADSVDFHQTFETMADHAVRQSSSTCYRRCAKSRCICPQKTGRDCFAGSSRNGPAIEINSDCCLDGTHWGEHTRTCQKESCGISCCVQRWRASPDCRKRPKSIDQSRVDISTPNHFSVSALLVPSLFTEVIAASNAWRKVSSP